MNRIARLFECKNHNILSVFFTAGFPHLDSTVPIIKELAKAGVDMVEIGVPFSDPMADGLVIQESSTKALKNGISVATICDQVREAREAVSEMPFIMMGYINPILQYGIENFFRDFKEAGADGVIIPDLPFEEYLRSFKSLSDKYDMPVIMLITPETSEARIHLIDDNCNGFIYMVSSASTTGTRTKFSEKQTDYFNHINSMDLKHPRLIGFGISNASTLRNVLDNAAGAIVGSLFIKCLQSEPTIHSAVAKLRESLSS